MIPYSVQEVNIKQTGMDSQSEQNKSTETESCLGSWEPSVQ